MDAPVEKPIVFVLDVEPDAFFVDRRAPDRWEHVEAMAGAVEAARPVLSAALGAPARFSWFLRFDPQIELAYGDAAFGARAFADLFDRALAAGDDIGVHVHPYRADGDDGWIEDFSDDAWVESCIRSSFDAYTDHFGRLPRAVSMGSDWFGAVALRVADALGFEVDCSPIAGHPGGVMRESRRRGTRPDLRGVAADAYRPRLDDVRVADPTRSTGLRVLPQTRVRPLSDRRIRSHRRRDPAWFRPRSGKLMLICPVDEVRWQLSRLASGAATYLTLAAASRSFQHDGAVAVFERNVEAIARHPAARSFVVTSAPDAIQRLF